MASREVVNGPGSYKRILPFLPRRIRTRTYIMPTRFGTSFGLMCLVLFFLAVGYSNNLVYIFFFFLVSVAFTGILITNRNVDSVELQALHGDELFVGEKNFLRAELKNTANGSSWDLSASLPKPQAVSNSIALSSQETAQVEIPFAPTQRGEVTLPRVVIQSTFPFGLLRAWKVYKKTPPFLVYPARVGDLKFPQKSVQGDEHLKSGLFRDHRPYQSSDPVARVDWKASARRQELLVKNYEENEKPSLYFSWDMTAGISDFEMRVSQLCLWIDEAEKQGHKYALLVGANKTAFSRGPLHRKSCLEILARLNAEDVV
ncbi:DUF58 domain-containing protein [Bdellovibrio sp. 22V]|uniref:DUF58 domain-containing protein n=1 Tax=Bdellovibrio sp. 22V TaxID=3044166 RepID=UPI002543811D|nr:DUF58 domain-containing protein [Bdellovibrio sp. 22V]WII73047.1 DUF58 domain-containing protein [Bdellovibrio sp. 22V]